MSLSLLEKARNAVTLKLNCLRASCEDLTVINVPEVEDSAGSESEMEEDDRKERHISQSKEKKHKKTEVKKPNEIDEVLKKAAKVTKYNEGPREGKRRRRLERAKTKGKKWFDLPATELTKETEMDLRLIRMRKVLNRKQFFKNNDTGAALPKYFQIGTVKDSAVEFYSNRIPKRQWKKHIIDELLEDADFRKFNKKKFDALNKSLVKKKLRK